MFIYNYKIVIMGLVIFLASCTVGPNFKQPELPSNTQYVRNPLPHQTISAQKEVEVQTFLKGIPVSQHWWLLFQSPELNTLIVRGINNNPTIEAAQAALCVAKENWLALVGQTLFPSVDSAFTATRQRFSAKAFGQETGPTSTTFNLFSSVLNFSYNLDIFGGGRRGIEALAALIDYQEYLLEAAYLNLSANIAVTAITQASLHEQIVATKSLITNEEKQLGILKKQFDLGAISQNEVLTEEAQLAQFKATLPPLEKSLTQANHALAVLVGELPSNIDLHLFHLNTLHLPTQLPISIPSKLIQQRPDIKAAQALMQQANAQIGIATAALFPNVNITGQYGWESNTLDSFFNPQNVIWNITGQVMQPIFHGGALLAKRRASIANYKQVAANYRQTVLVSFQNVADALRALEIDARALSVQMDAERAAQKSLVLTQQQYKLGSINYLFLLNANRQYEEAVIKRIQAQAQRYTDTVALFQALGGGW